MTVKTCVVLLTVRPQLVTVLVVLKMNMPELPYIERVVVIRQQGSIEFSQEELAADIVLVDVRCSALAGTIYTNKRTLPDYGYYGAVTLFGGSTIKEKIPLDFVYQRVIDFEQTYRRLYCFLTRLELKLKQIEGKLDSPDNIPPAEAPTLPVEFVYRGLPYSKLKIKSTVAAQWNITVRRYLEATGFACRSVSQSDDPTRNEPEYPTPLPIPNPNSYPPTLPAPTPPYPGANPDDYPPGTAIPWVPRTVYIGFSVMLTTGTVGGPSACTADAPRNYNEIWVNAGRPPYTFVRATQVSPSCTNARLGFHARDADGGMSPIYRQGGGSLYGEVVVWSYEPLG